MKSIVAVALISVLVSCGSSKVSGNNASNVGFDPSQSANLKTIHYDTFRRLLIVEFGLTPGSSQAISMLDTNRAVFDGFQLKFSSTFLNYFMRIMIRACQEVSDDQIFPDGKIEIDTAWKSFTGELAGTRAKELEQELLSKVSGEPDDVKKYTLCLGAATSAGTAFTNYVSTEQ